MTPAPPPADPAPPPAPERVAAALALLDSVEKLRQGGDRLWLVSWDGQAYTVRVVGQIRRRVSVDPP